MPETPLSRAWQKTHELALAVYRLSQKLPEEEKFGLTAQMRQAAVAAASALTECRELGTGAKGYVTGAAGEVAEVVYCLMLARDLGFVSEVDTREATALATEALRMINGLRR